MGEERIKIELDGELAARLEASGVSVEAYVESVLRRRAAGLETPEQRSAREAALRAEMQPGLDAYNRLIEEVGDWSEDLRVF